MSFIVARIHDIAYMLFLRSKSQTTDDSKQFMVWRKHPSRLYYDRDQWFSRTTKVH